MYQTNSHTNNVNFQIIGKFFVPCMPSLFLEASIEYVLDKIDEIFVLNRNPIIRYLHLMP